GAIAIALAVLSYAAVIVQYAFHLTGPAELVALEQARERKEFFLDIALARVLLLLGVFGVGAIALAVLFAADRAAASQATRWWVLLGLPIGAALHSGWYLQATGRLVVLSGLSIVATIGSVIVGLSLVDASSPTSAIWAAAALAIGPLFVGAGTFL